MKNVQKSIRKLIVEIILVSCFIVFSYFWWDNLDINKYQIFASSSYASNNLYVYEKESGGGDLLIPVSDEYAMANLKPSVIAIENATRSIKNYNLIVRVSKDSTLDYNLLNVSLDERIYKLKDLQKVEDDYNIYLIFDEDIIKDSREYEVRVWLDEQTTNDAMGKTLSFDFAVRENQTIVAIK